MLLTTAKHVVSAGGSVSLIGEPPPLPPLTLASKAESVASVTSQCSFSSTIVHVGDKKPPESGGNRGTLPLLKIPILTFVLLKADHKVFCLFCSFATFKV